MCQRQKEEEKEEHDAGRCRSTLADAGRCWQMLIHTAGPMVALQPAAAPTFLASRPSLLLSLSWAPPEALPMHTHTHSPVLAFIPFIQPSGHPLHGRPNTAMRSLCSRQPSTAHATLHDTDRHYCAPACFEASAPRVPHYWRRPAGCRVGRRRMLGRGAGMLGCAGTMRVGGCCPYRWRTDPSSPMLIQVLGRNNAS